VSARTHQPVRAGRARGYGGEGEGQGGERTGPRGHAYVWADTLMSARTHRRICADTLVFV
jgi:hypothetical protein